MCLVPELPGRWAGLQPVLSQAFLPEEQEGAQRAWVSCMTQGQGLPHQAQALPEELQEPSSRSSLAPGGAIHRLQWD